MAIDQTSVREVVLFTENDYNLWMNRRPNFERNLLKKLAADRYDSRQARKLWRYFADEAVKEYDRQFGSGRGSVAWLPPADRQAIADDFAEQFESEVAAGEYDDELLAAMTKKRKKELGVGRFVTGVWHPQS